MLDSKNPFRIAVTCYSGYRAEETPKGFRLGSHWIEVEAVVDRWLSPDHRYFKVKDADGAEYILRHDELADIWELTMYKSASALDFSPDGGR